MSATDAQSTLPAALRRWRESRRLSQLDLALLAGTTQRHLSFIEKGRSVPGRAMVLRLAESLELPLRERNALLLAGGYAPVFTEESLDDEALGPVREALWKVLAGYMPYPAILVDREGTLIAANAATTLLFEGAAPTLLTPPINVYRLAVHPDGMGPRARNLPEWGRHVIENTRLRALRNPDPRLDDLISELEEHVPSQPLERDHIGFAVPLILTCKQGEARLITTLTSFATALDVTLSELRLEAFLPEDQATARLCHDRALRAPLEATQLLPSELLVPSSLN